MPETDRQTDKTTRWAFTAFEEQWSLFNDIKEYRDVAEWGWQQEISPTTNKLHYQGYIRTHRQFRLAGMTKLFPKVHLEPARQWNALLNYCKKSDSAVAGTQVHATNTKEYYSMQRSLIELTYFDDEAEEYRELNRERNAQLSVAQTYKEDYWFRVRRVLVGKPDLASTYATPTMLNMWLNTKSVWYCEETRALVLQPALGSSGEPDSPRVILLSPDINNAPPQGQDQDQEQG